MTSIGSLFSGYGGLDMGVQQVIDARVAWHCEYEQAPSLILAHHWPDVPNLGDITTVDWSQVEPVDIITGGSPCQDLSHAGARKGMTDGARSNLWVQMRECVAALRPSMVVWENVRGAYSAAADSDVESCAGCVGDGSDVNLRALGRVLGDLADLGFNAQWHGLLAADVGAPHGRFRVFVVAHAADNRRPERNDRRRNNEGRAAASIAQSATAHAQNLGHERIGGTRPGRAGPANRSEPTADDDRDGRTRDTLGQPIERTATTRRGEIDWGVYGPAIERWQSILGRTAPAPTEPGSRGGQRLSPRFVEFLMGLPDGHVTDVPGISRNAQLKALGNGVVPQQAAAAVRLMLPAIRERAA